MQPLLRGVGGARAERHWAAVTGGRLRMKAGLAWWVLDWRARELVGWRHSEERGTWMLAEQGGREGAQNQSWELLVFQKPTFSSQQREEG